MTIAGEAWNCPHCGARILRSAVACPACRRHLRLDALTAGRPVRPMQCPLGVDATIRHPGDAAPWEYSVVIEVRGDRDDLIDRRIVSVGALQPGQTRRVTFRIEMQAPEPSSAPAASVSARRP